jgi:hypothetical protein
MPSKLQVVFEVVDSGSKQLDKIRGRVERVGTQMARSLNAASMAMGLGAVAGAAAFVAVGKAAINAASQVETWQRQLLAVTKSATEADAALNAIREFGRVSPLETEDVVQAYIRLRAVGIDPTAKQMETLGGVALLFNRDLSSMADAFIGMNKRTLRELGVEIDRTGKKATIASGDIRITTNKDTASIRAALLEVWEKRFPDAMKMASDTYKSKVAIMKSEWWELMAGIGQSLLPTNKAAIDIITKDLQTVRENLHLIRGSIMGVITAVTILWNGFQIAADAIVYAARTIWNAISFMGKGIWNIMQIVTRSLQAIGAAVAAVTVAVGKSTAAAVTGQFGDIAGIWKEAGATLKVVWDDVAGGITQDLNDWTEAGKNAWGAFVTDSKTASTSTHKNLQDIADSILLTAAAFEKVEDKLTGAKLTGTGGLGGAGAGADMSAMKNRATLLDGLIKADKEEIRLIGEKIKATEAYAQLIVDSVTNAYEKQRLEVDMQETEALANAQRWLNQGAIQQQRYEEMKTQITANGAEARAKIAQAEASATIKYSVRATTAIATLLRTAVENSKAAAKDKQNILYGLAIAQAAAAAVEGIYAVWTDDSISSVWAKIAMTAVVAAEIIAAAWVEIDQIKSASFARGTSFAPGGRALVGEQGPEMVNLPRGAQVMTNYQTRNTLSQPVNITINASGGNAGETARTVRGEMENFARKFNEATRYGYLRRGDLERALA